jgi:hypothetical protein
MIPPFETFEISGNIYTLNVKAAGSSEVLELISKRQLDVTTQNTH